MKVFIGDYSNRWNSHVYSNYINRKYGRFGEHPRIEDHTFVENVLYHTEEFLQGIYNQTVNIFIDNTKRKIKVKIHSYDTWNLDVTLAHIIYSALKLLKKTTHGAPLVDNEDVPENLRSIATDKYGMEESTTFQKWDWVLDEMIYAFGTLVDEDWEDQFYSYDSTLQSPAQLEAFKAAEERRNNGFKLFGKYYLGLWD